MPASKSRPQHNTHQQHHHGPHNAKPKKKGKASIIAALFFALFGIGISYFIAGNSWLSLGSGAIIGTIAGYLFGRQIDQTVSKK